MYPNLCKKKWYTCWLSECRVFLAIGTASCRFPHREYLYKRPEAWLESYFCVVHVKDVIKSGFCVSKDCQKVSFDPICFVSNHVSIDPVWCQTMFFDPICIVSDHVCIDPVWCQTMFVLILFGVKPCFLILFVLCQTMSFDHICIVSKQCPVQIIIWI